MELANVMSLAERRERAPSERSPEPPAHFAKTPPRASVGAEVRVVVVHPEPGFRGQVAAHVGGEGIAVVGEAGAADAVGEPLPDVVVIGHRQPGVSAIDICEALRRNGACPPVVIVAHAPRAVLMRRAIQVGAAAFVGHTAPAAVLRDAVRCAATGGKFLDPGLSALAVEIIARPPASERPYKLTPAQLDVVSLLPKGLPNREIAAELGISENTVKTHLRHALKKLGVRDRAQAAALVVRERLA